MFLIWNLFSFPKKFAPVSIDSEKAQKLQNSFLRAEEIQKVFFAMQFSFESSGFF